MDTYLNEKITSALLYKDEKDNKIKPVTSPDGIAIENVVSMTSEKSGNIWLLSRSGLFRIDTAEKSPGLA